jgi:Signal transduction histidine kinase
MTGDGKANILIVDDRPENLLAMESILDGLDQNLVRAGSAREALRYLLTEDVALIILDVQMPGVNGFELAELIRERERTQHTPLIFVSAISHSDQYIFKGYSLGAVDYLTKPFEPEILRSKVRFFSKLFHQNRKIKKQTELLEDSNKQLDELNADLELRVTKRTAELEKANKELELQVEERKQSEERLATEHAITLTLAEASSADIGFPAILRIFCENLNASVACLWLLSETGEELSCSYIETKPGSADLAAFVAETRRLSVRRGVGIPGQVWEKGTAVWLPNTVRGSNHPRAELAATVGIHSALGFPVKIGRQFYGVIEFFTRQPFLSDRQTVNMFEAIGSEVGQFVQRKQAETDREKLLLREKSLREQAETASRLKDEFLATVSHELRTPLNAVLGWAEMLHTGKLDEAKKIDALATIYRNARMQSQLIDDLLDASRLITGNLRLNLSPTSLKSVIEAAIDIVRPAAESRDIKFTTDFNSDIDTVTCDSQRLQQMVWNLLTNAVKFTQNNGEIKVSFKKEKDNIKISVSDSGHGIEPDFLPFVFDRFRQADSSSTRTHDGLGLGLAIVRHLAELHGGSVSVQSQGVGQGATFTVSLPVSLATAVPAIDLPRAGSNGKVSMVSANGRLDGVRVMVVDDDSDTCELLNFALSQVGAEVRTGQSVDEAFSILQEWRPDVLLTDINMPETDGYSFLAKLRSELIMDTAEIPAIAVTAMARPEDTEKALSAGFNFHIAKPIDFDELSSLISKVVPAKATNLSV